MPTSPPESLRGATTPRVELAPEFVHSYGDDAIELAHKAGLDLDEWQQRALTLMLGERDDGKWACFEYAEIVARQNGKGAILEARALAGLFGLGERMILWSAHRVDTAGNAFDRLVGLIKNLGGEEDKDNVIWVSGMPVRVWSGYGQQRLMRLDTRQEIRYVARSKGANRGLSGDLVFIDEALEYNSAQQDAMMPTTIARPNPQIVYTSSPPYDGESGEVLFQIRKRALDGEDGALGYRDWGIKGDLDNLHKIDLDDRELWAASNPAMGTRITEERITTMRRSMGDEGFAREILSVWPKEKLGGGAIDMATWAQLSAPESTREGDVALAVDIAPQRDYAAIGVYGQRADGVGHVQLVDYRPGTEWLIERIVDLSAVLRPVAIGMGRAVAASLEVELNKHDLYRSENPDEPVHGDLAVTNSVDMSAAAGQMLDAVKQGALRHIGQRELDASVSGAKIKQTGDTVVWARKESDADTSPLVAASIARWAFESRAHLVQEQSYDVLSSVW